MILAACDPGVSGKLAIKHEDGSIELKGFPIIKKPKKGRDGKIKNWSYYDINSMGDLFPQVDKGICFVELVNSRPHDSAHNRTLLVYGRALLTGLAIAKGFEIVEKSPAGWHRRLGLKSGSTKEDSRQLAIDFYPELKGLMKFKKDHDVAEALLMLKYLELTVNPPAKKGKKNG